MADKNHYNWGESNGKFKISHSKYQFGVPNMEKGIRIADLFGNEQEYIGKKVLVQGWVRTKRDSKAGISFIELNDGSSLKSLQVIAEPDAPAYSEVLPKITTGSAILAKGSYRPRQAKGRASNSRPNESTSTAGPTRRDILSRKNGTPSNTFARLLTSGPGQTR